MYWTLELASYLEDAPWPATKDELIDFSMRTGAPWRWWKICNTWRTMENPTTPSRIFGRIIPPKKISSSTKTSISDVVGDVVQERSGSQGTFVKSKAGLSSRPTWIELKRIPKIPFVPHQRRPFLWSRQCDSNVSNFQMAFCFFGTSISPFRDNRSIAQHPPPRRFRSLFNQNASPGSKPLDEFQ